jgi:hypothetical protein
MTGDKRAFKRVLKHHRNERRKSPASVTGRLGARARRRTGKVYRNEPSGGPYV